MPMKSGTRLMGLMAVKKATKSVAIRANIDA